MTLPRSIDKLVHEQVSRWNVAGKSRSSNEIPDPVITISRLPGCYGRTYAKELAEKLNYDYFDREILHEIAERSNLSEAIIETVDNKVISSIDEWIRSLFLDRNISMREYFRHLTKVLLTIANHGGAIILGRGASLIIPPERSLRIMLVAPLNDRINVMAQYKQISYSEAKKQMAGIESERFDFIKRHFHTQMTDAVNYDLVINTSTMSHAQVLATILAALESKKKHQ